MNQVLNNNAIINYSLKLTNYTSTQETLEMLSAGFLTLFVYRSFVGKRAESIFVNFLGQKKGRPIYSCAVFVFLIMLWRQIDQYPRLNVNKLVNPYDPNGEMMLSIILKLFPHKVNHKYAEQLKEKYGLQLHSNMGYTQNYPYKLNETVQDQLQTQYQQKMGILNQTEYMQQAQPMQGPPQGMQMHPNPFMPPSIGMAAVGNPNMPQQMYPPQMYPNPHMQYPPQGGYHGYPQDMGNYYPQPGAPYQPSENMQNQPTPTTEQAENTQANQKEPQTQSANPQPVNPNLPPHPPKLILHPGAQIPKENLPKELQQVFITLKVNLIKMHQTNLPMLQKLSKNTFYFY